MRGRGQHAGDDGVPHGERQHGVNHEHDEQEERHLWAERDGNEVPAEENDRQNEKYEEKVQGTLLPASWKVFTLAPSQLESRC